MSVPIFHEMLLPILHHISDGNPHRPTDTLAYVTSQFPLTEEDLAERLPNGRTRLMDRVLWAITYLRKSGLLESVSWGVFKITERGRELLAERPQRLGLRDLERYPEYLEFKGRGAREASESIKNSPPITSEEETPEEELQRIFTAIRARLEGELLDAFLNSSPTFFEKMIKEDRLGLDVIHIQAKRWKDKVVGRPDIQNFAGSLEGQRGRKGVFITTSSFTADAREYVYRIEKKIILIDGPELARLCLDFGIGVVIQNTYSIKKLDPDFFIEE